MNLDSSKIAENLLELASEQRISIIIHLLEEKSNLTKLAKELDATTSEVHRNLNRLMKTGIIIKESDGNYTLSNYGNAVCLQIPSLLFIPENRKFFDEHDIGQLETKFIQRLGALQEHEHIKGFVKVLEKWKLVHKNSQKYIYNILTEVPYSEDVIDIITSKLKDKINMRSIFVEGVIVSDERKEIFNKKNFSQYIKDGTLERKMSKKTGVITLVNEKEACIIFLKSNGDSDLGEMLYSSDPLFHEWCLDFFNNCWNNSTSFQESKL